MTANLEPAGTKLIFPIGGELQIEYLWYSIFLILIWPQKGAKSTIIKLRGL